MPSYEDFVRDYWAPDRDQVLADMQAQQTTQPTYDDFVRDYHAPDRDAVLASMRPQTDLGPNNAPGGYGGYNPGQQGGGVSGNPNAFRDAWLGSGGRTVADLKNFVAAHPEFGATLGGSKGDKVYGPGGAFWADAVISAGTGGNGASWQTDTGGGGGGAVSGASFGQAPNSTPFSYAAFQAPDPFSFRAFEAPTGLTEENDPGYQARLALGQQGVERSAAARGTLLTGGTLKDINDYAQNQASQEFQNVYNRAQQTYGTQYQQAAGDYNTNYQNALNAYKTNFDTSFQPWQANYNQAYQSWQGNFNAANQGFQNNLASQGQQFNQLYNTAQLGLQGTNAYGNAVGNYGNSLSGIYSGYGNQAGENITGAGNAQGAAQIAQGNAYGNLANNVTNLGLYASLLREEVVMPIDAGIYGAAQGQPVASPMQTLAQISQMQNMQMQRQEAQQRIGLAADELKIRQDAAAAKVKEEADKTAAEGAVAPYKLGQLSHDDILTGIANNPDLAPDVKNAAVNIINTFQKQAAEVAASEATAGKNNQEAYRLKRKSISDLGRGNRDVFGYAPDALDTTFEEMATTNLMEPKVLKLYHDAWINSGKDPAVGKKIVDYMIDQGADEYTLNVGDRRMSGIGTTVAEGGQPKPDKPTEFENFIMGPYAKSLGKEPFKTPGDAWGGLTSQEIDRAKEIMRADQRTSVTVQMQQQADKAWEGINPEMRLAASRAINNLPGKRPDYWKKTILDAQNSGNEAQIPGMIQQAAIESESVADKGVIMGRRNMSKAMTDMATAVQQLPPTYSNYIRGTAEDTLRAIGETTDPTLVRFKARVEASLANYRRSITGAAFSENEAKEYEKRFPNYRSSMPVNMAVIQGFLDDLNGNDQVYWETKLGPEGAKLVGALTPVNVMGNKTGNPTGQNSTGTGKVEKWGLNPATGKYEKQ